MVKVKTSKFDWKIGLTKFGKNALYIIIAGIASVYGNNPYYLAIAPLLASIENYVKHR